MAMLEVKDLEVYYGMIQAIKGISFEGRKLSLRYPAHYHLYRQWQVHRSSPLQIGRAHV